MLPELWTVCLLGLTETKHLIIMKRGECLALLSVGRLQFLWEWDLLKAAESDLLL